MYLLIFELILLPILVVLALILLHATRVHFKRVAQWHQIQHLGEQITNRITAQYQELQRTKILVGSQAKELLGATGIEAILAGADIAKIAPTSYSDEFIKSAFYSGYDKSQMNFISLSLWIPGFPHFLCVVIYGVREPTHADKGDYFYQIHSPDGQMKRCVKANWGLSNMSNLLFELVELVVENKSEQLKVS